MGCLDGNWRVSGEWPEIGRGFGPCFDVLADVKSGALGWWWPNNTLSLRNVGYRFLARLSWIRSFFKSGQR